MKDKQSFKNAELKVTDTICQDCGKTHSQRSSFWSAFGRKGDVCKCTGGAKISQLSAPEEEDEPLLPRDVRKPGDMVARHYKVIECLGSGGMSVVYKADHLLMDKIVAIKQLLESSAPSQKMVLRMQQEAKAISKLRHENIVRVGEFGLDDQGLPYLVMDYIEGEPLSSAISQQGSLSSDETYKFAIQVASGLEHAHAQGIVHRDIKPANIIITRQSEGDRIAVIVDFGIARLENTETGKKQSLTQTGELFGSPLYMSPEQCRGEVVDHRSDIYSLGCVLYECVFGRPPFTSASRITTMMMHISDTPSISENVCGNPMKIVLQRCLAKNVSDRYQSATELIEDLEKARHGVMPAKIATRLANEQLSGKQIATSVGLVILLIASFFGWYLWNAASQAPVPGGVTLPSAEQVKKEKWKFYGSSPQDFNKGKQPPHVVRPLGSATAGDAYAEADAMDNSARQYFQQGEYAKAISLLEFAASTYKEGGRHYNNDPDIETSYLGDTHNLLGKCHKMLNQWDEAWKHYRECLRLYNKVKKMKLKYYQDAVSGYAETLDNVGLTEESDLVIKEFQDTGKVLPRN